MLKNLFVLIAVAIMAVSALPVDDAEVPRDVGKTLRFDVNWLLKF